MIILDGPSRIIQLDSAPTVSIPAVYSRWVDWASEADNAKYLPAFVTLANPPRVPVYATLTNGWRVRPSPGAYTLTLNGGFLNEQSGADPLVPVASGVEPRVRYENPIVAVGFESGSGLSVAQDQLLARLEAASDRAEKLLRSDPHFEPDRTRWYEEGTDAVLMEKAATGGTLPGAVRMAEVAE